MDAVESPDFGSWRNIRRRFYDVADISVSAALTIAPDDELQINAVNDHG
jgi:hypothetical protein